MVTRRNLLKASALLAGAAGIGGVCSGRGLAHVKERIPNLEAYKDFLTERLLA